MNLENDPEYASQLCREAQLRLTHRVAQLSEQDIAAPSLLPGWSVGHVLTHLARNADGHARRLVGALEGKDLPKYADGEEQRRQEIADGAACPASEILADLEASMEYLEAVFSQCSAAGWPNGELLGGGHYGVSACPAHRLREVEMHHVDLGLGYTPSDWPEDYVAWDLSELLATVPQRLGSLADRRTLMAWLAGRAPLDPATSLSPW